VSLEDTLANWTGPSNPSEQERQDRTERMVREAIQNHRPLSKSRLSVYAKGSYANNTNVRADSNVDIAVQCHEVEYWNDDSAGAHSPAPRYAAIWTPDKLRAEVGAALRAKFPGQVEDAGSTAFMVKSGTARIAADVVPCFDYRYYFSSGGFRDGTKIFRKNGDSFENFPAQQLENGNGKNTRTRTRYKKCVRVLKHAESAMVENLAHRAVPSFLIECLAYNCPDALFLRYSWTERVRDILAHVWNGLEGGEPSEPSERWLEVNECKYLFDPNQNWTRSDGRDFAKAAWNYLGYGS
jgi:hypothetical protein